MAKQKVKTKRPIKLPPVLIQLGRVISVTGMDAVFKFTASSKTLLWCPPSGSSLYCFPKLWIAKPSTGQDFKKAVDSRWDETKAGVNLYQRWSEFEPASGSLGKPPRGFLFKVDRAQSIVYSSDKWVGRNRNYIHEFTSLPIVWANRKTDPTLLVLTGGRIKVQKRGITG